MTMVIPSSFYISYDDLYVITIVYECHLVYIILLISILKFVYKLYLQFKYGRNYIGIEVIVFPSVFMLRKHRSTTLKKAMHEWPFRSLFII